MDTNHCRRCFRNSLAALCTVVLLLAILPAHGQEVVPLLNYPSEWKYDQTARDLGSEWRTDSYDDSTWPSGPGLFGIESTPQVYPPILTPLALIAPGNNSQTITYYFRTHFQFTNDPAGVTLRATNLVDDGCVIYLNGIEAGRIRVQAGQTFQSLASGGPATEGIADVLSFATNLLRRGDNLLAVEVHQVSVNSGDIVWGTSLTALVPQTLVITNQPRSVTNLIGSVTTFSVGVAGGPVAYQWRKNGTNLAGATSAAFVIANTQPSHAGAYSVVVSNAVSLVISSDAILSVMPDTSGLRLLSAFVSESGQTNQVIVTFSERLYNPSASPGVHNRASATNTGNYIITRFGTTDRVTVTNALYNPGAPPFSFPQIILRVGGPNWQFGDDYLLTVSDIRDNSANTNVIIPDTQIGIGWPQHTNIFGYETFWHYTDGIFEPGVITNNWFAPDFVESSWWAVGQAPFGAGIAPECFDAFVTPFDFVPGTMLFRTTFDWPAGLPMTATINMTHVVDDGAVFYLNGVEILRFNVPSGPINDSIRALVVAEPTCITFNIAGTKFRPGTNWIAAAVFQAGPAPQSDFAFALSLAATTYRTPSLPTLPPPLLQFARPGPDALRLSWTGPGFALESTTNFAPGPNPLPGPWLEVPNMANPYTNHSATDLFKIYRLRK